MNEAEKLIVERFRKESFTRNTINDINDLYKYMSKYDLEFNSISRYKDKIVNGTFRRFFTRESGISKIKWGRVYHHINNMWWIVISKKKFTNIASFDILEELLPTTKQLKKLYSEEGTDKFSKQSH